jgi:HK97 family phage portal protein
VKSGLRRLLNAGKAPQGPPVPLTTNYRRGQSFDLGVGKASRETFMRQYGQSGTVFAIVSLLAQSSASPRWHLYKKPVTDGRVRYSSSDQGSDQRIEVVRHPALSLWNKPNDFMTGYEFREGSQQHEELTGETFWVLNRELVTFPTAMWYVRPDRLEPQPDPDDYIVGWIYTAPNGQKVPLKLDEVIQEKIPDPLDPFRGAGPVASIMPNIQQQRYATEFQRNKFINSADPGGVITFPGGGLGGTVRMSDKEFDEFTDRWRESHQGVARAAAVAVLENGATFTPVGTTNKDMDYANLRLTNRDEIRETWRIHKANLGTSDDVNRANAQTAAELFSSDQVIPRLERRRDTLNYKLLPMFGDDSVEFDFDDPSPENAEAAMVELGEKAKAFTAFVDGGMDPHDALELAGLPDADFVERATQVPAVPPAWVPAPPAAPAPGADPAQPEDMAALVRRVLNNGYVPVETGGRR